MPLKEFHPTKQKIIQIARELFMEIGYSETSTRQIALAVGITQPNLYHHFKTKEQILLAVIESLGAEVKLALTNIQSASSGSLSDKLNKVFLYLKEIHPTNMYGIFSDMLEHVSDQGGQEIYSLWRSSYLQPVIDILDDQSINHPVYSSEILARHFYAIIAPYLRPASSNLHYLKAEDVIHLYIHGFM